MATRTPGPSRSRAGPPPCARSGSAQPAPSPTTRRHLGRKAEVREEADGAQLLVIAGGTCRMSGDDAALRSAAAAPDDEALVRVEEVVGGHLERFAQAEGLVVRWERGA